MAISKPRHCSLKCILLHHMFMNLSGRSSAAQSMYGMPAGVGCQHSAGPAPAAADHFACARYAAWRRRQHLPSAASPHQHVAAHHHQQAHHAGHHPAPPRVHLSCCVLQIYQEVAASANLKILWWWARVLWTSAMPCSCSCTYTYC